MELLTPYQISMVRTYFFALARLRGEEFEDVEDELLSTCTGTYCYIELDGGGNPILAAEKALKKMTLTGRFGRAAKAFNPYWLSPNQTWN